MLIVAKHATIFIRGISGEEGAAASTMMTPPEDRVQVAPSPEPQGVPDWVRETRTWANGIKDGRLREVGVDGATIQPMPVSAIAVKPQNAAGPQPPDGVKVEPGEPIRVGES